MPDKNLKKENTDKTAEAPEHRLRIKVRSFDHKLIDHACLTIIDNALRTQATVKGPVPLPTDKDRYTVNRSTFVHKDAR